MGNLVVCTNLTLDGVMQSPARPEEDTRDSFPHGGWGAPYAGMIEVGGVFAGTGALLLGRRTYMDFYDVWPKRPDSPFTPWLNRIPKYVASRTLGRPLPWENSVLLEGDLGAAVTALKRELTKDILVMGSGNLVQTLMHADLVDEWVLLIHPVVLGTGRRLCAEGSPPTTLALVESKATARGVLVATYRPAGRA